MNCWEFIPDARASLIHAKVANKVPCRLPEVSPCPPRWRACAGPGAKLSQVPLAMTKCAWGGGGLAVGLGKIPVPLGRSAKYRLSNKRYFCEHGTTSSTLQGTNVY